MRAVIAILCVALAPGALHSQDSRVVGRQIDLRLRGPEAHVRGELLAVRRDSIWVLNQNSLVALDLSGIEQATIRRHGLTGERSFLWGLGAGLVSGIGLSIACTAADAESCGAVVAASGLMGLIWGGLAAISLSSSSRWKFTPPVADSLARFARFPQGPPPGGMSAVARSPSDSSRSP